jgi:hypothetical protein
MIFLKLWFGLVVRYRLPARQRMECAAFSFVGDLLLGGALWLDHLVFAFSASFSPGSFARICRHRDRIDLPYRGRKLPSFFNSSIMSGVT